MTRTDEELLAALRGPTFGVAYRMLGSVGEAEDVVQETLLRVHRELTTGHLESPQAFATTVATRLALDQLRSARVRRESYVGEWLPEPLVDDPTADPAAHAELADSLSMAFLLLLERLSPRQRAAFLLHDVFDYAYREVADALDTSEANARQLALRARRDLAAGRPRHRPSPAEVADLSDRFLAALTEGSPEALEVLLADDVVLHGDGGGRVPALAQPVRGRSRVTRTLLAWARRLGAAPGMSVRPATVNGGPGAVALDARGRVASVLALEVADGLVVGVASVVNPEKLRHLGEPADLTGLYVDHASEGEH